MYVNTLQDSACFQDFSPIFHILVSIWQLMWVGVQQIGKFVFIDTGRPLNFSRLCAIHSVSVHFDVHNYQRKDFLNVLTIGFMICKLTHVNKMYLIWWLWYIFRRTVLFFYCTCWETVLCLAFLYFIHIHNIPCCIVMYFLYSYIFIYMLVLLFYTVFCIASIWYGNCFIIFLCI